MADILIPRRETGHESTLYDIDPKYGFVSRYLDPELDAEQIDQALVLEQVIWDRKDYHAEELEEYEKYKNQMRVFASFLGGQCVGVVRMFRGSPEYPPFVEKMHVADPFMKFDLENKCIDGAIEELGTAAVDDMVIKEDTLVAKALWRLAYRDAVARGIDEWGIVMEPQRVKAMNWRYGFNFKQLGDKRYYQGGWCAAHWANLPELMDGMRTVKPRYYDYFALERLNDPRQDPS